PYTTPKLDPPCAGTCSNLSGYRTYQDLPLTYAVELFQLEPPAAIWKQPILTISGGIWDEPQNKHSHPDEYVSIKTNNHRIGILHFRPSWEIGQPLQFS